MFSFWDAVLETVPGLRINHGEVRHASFGPRSRDPTQDEGAKGELKADCTFSFAFGHDRRLDVGMAEFGRYCVAGCEFGKWHSDSQKLFISMRDMVANIYRAVDGNVEVMQKIVFGIVGSDSEQTSP